MSISQAEPMSVPEIQTASAESVRVNDIVALLLACVALWGWTYGLWDYWGPDEPRYVQISRELLTRSNWLVLTVNGEPYDQKPPLPFWIMAAMLKLAGGSVTPWAGRFPSVLFGALTVLLTYLIGLRRFNRRVGWLAAWIVMTSPLFMDETAAARLDIPFTFFIALSMWAWLGRRPEEPLGPGRTAVFWLGAIGAFFIKGPLPVLVFVLAPLALEAWRARSWRVISETRPKPGLLVFAALAGAWVWSQKHYVSSDFVEGQIFSAIEERLFKPELHRKNFFYYLEVIFGDGFMPWTLILVAAMWYLWRLRRSSDPGRLALRPVLGWFLISLLLLSLPPGKREQYLLPAFPAMALITGWYLDRWLLDKPVPVWLRRFAAAVSLIAGLAALFIAVELTLRPDHAHQQLIFPARGHLLILGLCGIMLIFFASRWLKAAVWKNAVVLMALTIYFGGIAAFGAIYPAVNPRNSSRPLAEFIDPRLPADQKVIGALGNTATPRYQVYGDYRIIDLKSNAKYLRKNAKRLPRLILAEDDQLEKLDSVLKELGYQQIYQARTERNEAVYERTERVPSNQPLKAGEEAR